MIDRKTFFDAVRREPFGGRLTAAQVTNVERIIDEWERRELTDPRQLAYMLATVFHETGPASQSGHMAPITERGQRSYFNKYEPGTRIGRVLGNTVKGDGYRFRGRGYVQLTGRSNYHRAGTALGVDLLGRPERALEPRLAAAIMFMGMAGGWFTGKKLRDYFNDQKTDWRNARRIINGLDRAALIAGYGRAFYEALKAAEKPANAIPPPPDIEPPPPPKPPSMSPTGRQTALGAAIVAASASVLLLWEKLAAWWQSVIN